MLYKVEITNSSGTVLADLSSRYLSLEYSKQRNRSTLINISFDLYDIEQYAKLIGTTVPALFATNTNEIKIYRDTTLIASGQIFYYQPSLEVSAILNVRAYDMLSVLRYRNTEGTLVTNEEVFTAADAGQIAKKLIDDTQARTNGDLGITSGTIQASVNRDRTYFIKNIYDAIIQLSEVQNGFDFEITPSKVFNVYYPKIGQDRPDIVLTYPGNILTLTLERDGQNYANAVWVNGVGTGSERLTYYADDPAVQGVYKIRETVEEFPDVSNTTTLQTHAEEELRIGKSFKNILSITINGLTPEIGTYSIGDTITLDIDPVYTAFSVAGDKVRVEAYTVDVNSEDFERVSLKVVNV